MMLEHKIDDELLFAEEDDELIFLDEPEEQDKAGGSDIWKILIVDDHEEVHRVTKLVLNDFVFEEKKLAFLHAYSGAEAKAILQEHSDIAVVLLDVVMEEDDAGLEVVEFIRNVLKNSAIRIILRTGQPGQAPENQVILKYDINDYREKTELTSQKLFTTLVSSLRSYRDVRTIESNKKGLEDVINSSSHILKILSVKKLASQVLTQIASILGVEGDAFQYGGLAVAKENEAYTVLAGGGEFSGYEGSNTWELHTLNKLEAAFQAKEHIFESHCFSFYFPSHAGVEKVVYVQSPKPLSEWDRYLVEIYCTNVSAVFENIHLNKEIENTQKEIIFTLGEIAETRSKETGFHVKRVAEYTKILAAKYDFSEEEVELIGLASPMHDIGKVGISDDVLNKPGKLTELEYEIMKTHAQIGYEMLKHSERPIMRAAAIIAWQHHEKYNGKGYPQGLKGEEIHIYGRLTAIADVFDALASDRVYKKAWDLDSIVLFFKEQRGEYFDPVLTDLFLQHLDEFLVVREKYKDEKIF